MLGPEDLQQGRPRRILVAQALDGEPLTSERLKSEVSVALLSRGYQAAGLIIAIPVSIGHNYFVARIDSLVIDMEESAQKMIDALHAIERGRQAAAS